MKRIFMAMMAVAAIALTSCVQESGTGVVKWGFASQTDPKGFDTDGIRIGQEAYVINYISEAFNKASDWNVTSTTYNGTGEAMSVMAISANTCEKGAKACFESGIAAFQKAYTDDGYKEITDDSSYDMHLRLLYRIATRDDYQVYDVTIHKFEVNPQK